VIKPSLKCDETQPMDKYNEMYTGPRVSKLMMNDENFNEEKDLNTRIHKIDSTGRYFVIPIAACRADKAQLQKVNFVIDKCNTLKGRTQTTPINQILMPYGGVSLFKYITTLTQLLPLKTWILMLENVIDGIVRLRENKVCHFDIKPENMVYDGKTIKLIDFGLSKTFDDIYAAYHNIVAADDYDTSTTAVFTNYTFWPIELYAYRYGTYFNEQAGDYDYSDGTFYYTYISKISVAPHSSAKNYVSLICNHYHNHNQKTKTTYNKLVSDMSTTQDIRKALETHAVIEKIDVYSLGISCIWFHEYLDFTEVSPYFKSAYRTFISKMTHFDYNQRASVNEMLSMYKALKRDLYL
jgi:serine/threonine protein kinase